MAKVTITHEFDYYTDRCEFNVIMHASQVVMALHDLDSNLRTMIKHGDGDWLTDEAYQYLQSLRDLIADSHALQDQG